MTKRITAVFLCTVLAVSLAACGKKPQQQQPKDPKELFTTASTNMQKLKYTDMTMKIKVASTIDGEETEMELGMDSKIKKNSDTDLVMSALMTMTMEGQTLEIPTYYADGYSYTEFLGTKMKTATPVDEFLASDMSSMMNMDPSTFQDYKFVSSENGSSVISFTADPSKLSSLIDSLKSSMSATAGNLPDDANMKFSSLSGQVTINEDSYFTAMELSMDCSITVNDTPTDYHYDIQITVNNPGADGEVTLPDLSDFQEANTNAQTPAA